jgi:hypothetical protein
VVSWALLAYRVPREPSTPRIAVWRTLKRLGVAQIGDGLVALPADSRTVEALEWVADDVVQAGGTATLWRARLNSPGAEREIIAAMATARAAEYTALAAKADGTLASAESRLNAADGLRHLRMLRRELRQVQRRDFFPPPERHRARAAVQALADQLQEVATPVASSRQGDG